MDKSILPYGNWPSTISADMVAGQSVRFGPVRADGESLYWSESRPSEKGRGVIVCRDADGIIRDINPPPFSARSRVHEYGGGEFTPAAGAVYFVNFADQDIYAIEAEGEPERITDAPGMRFADMVVDWQRERLIAVAEHHRGDHDPMPANLLVAIDLAEGRRGRIAELAKGRDFYASPCLSPDGATLAWLEWSLPAMPWAGAELHVAELDGMGVLGGARRIAGGGGSAVFQPEWGGDGTLFFVWDASGWGNLHCWRDGRVDCVLGLDAEFGRPQWVFGMRSFAVLGGGGILATFLEDGRFRCGLVDVASGVLTRLDSEARGYDSVVAIGAGAAAVVTYDDAPPAVTMIIPAPAGRARLDRVRSSADVRLDAADVSVGRPVSFASGEDGEVHAIHYPPASARWRGEPDSAPPAIVMVHGGPTAYADRGLRLKVQYWTSRGFAVLDLDFAGSFGYGRAFREALDGTWGVRDAAHAAAAARWLATSGHADPRRIVITGGSAGGYTALNALVQHDAFAGASAYYGISDMALLAKTTHKFESGYVATLTGIPAYAPDEAYRAISPLWNAERIDRPVILLQGDEDKVVPPEQSRAIAEALERRGVPVFYVEYPGEGHGFRQSQNMIDAILREHSFYARILGLEPADRLPDLDRPNLETYR
jgi:dipeptidyl aminopeptidase/acylaminoacyl peptidase